MVDIEVFKSKNGQQYSFFFDALIQFIKSCSTEFAHLLLPLNHVHSVYMIKKYTKLAALNCCGHEADDLEEEEEN